jgi:fatty acid synthesis protein
LQNPTRFPGVSVCFGCYALDCPSFAGNVEGGDLMAGAVDVIVTDGFTCNVALKTLEGSMRFADAELRSALAGSLAHGDITERIRERLGVTGERSAGHFRRRDREG